MNSEIKDLISASISLKQKMLEDVALHEGIERLANLCLESLRSGGKIIFAGNGGSFADSQHLSAEFVSRLQFDRAPLASVALGTNSSAITAIGNDYGFDQVFARELAAIATKKDVFIPITTSGNSPNIIKAIEVANQQGITTFGFTGLKGGKMAALCPCLFMPEERTERIQEGHILVGHILCGLVETAYFKGAQT